MDRRLTEVEEMLEAGLTPALASIDASASLDELEHVIGLGLRGELLAKRVSGRGLNLAKEKLGYRAFGQWLKEHFEKKYGLTQSSANDYMIVDREWDRVMAEDSSVRSIRAFMRVYERLHPKPGKRAGTAAVTTAAGTTTAPILAAPAAEKEGEISGHAQKSGQTPVATRQETFQAAWGPRPPVALEPEPEPAPAPPQEVQAETAPEQEEDDVTLTSEEKQSVDRLLALLGRMSPEELAKVGARLPQEVKDRLRKAGTQEQQEEGEQEEEEPWPQATFADSPRSTLSAAMRAALQRDYMGNRGLWGMSRNWSAPKTVEYALYGLAALHRLNREGCTAQDLHAMVGINHAESLLYGVRLLGQLAVRNLRRDVVAKETALRLLQEQVHREDVLRLLRELSVDEQQWVLDQVRPVTEPEPESAAPPRSPGSGLLGARRPGVFIVRPYWADSEGSIEPQRITAQSALSAAKEFVRSCTHDLTADGEEKPYRGAIRIEEVTGVLDEGEVFQGYRHPDPRAEEEWHGGEWQPVGPRLYVTVVE